MHCVCRVDKENTRVIQWIQTYWLHNVYYMCDLACIRSALRRNSQSRAIKDNVHVSDNKFVSIGLHGMLVYTKSEWFNSIYRKERQKVHRSYIFHSLPQLCHRVIAALHYTGSSRTERSKEYDGGQSLQKWIDKARRHRAIFHDEHCDGDDVDMQSEGKAPATNVDCRR